VVVVAAVVVIVVIIAVLASGGDSTPSSTTVTTTAGSTTTGSATTGSATTAAPTTAPPTTATPTTAPPTTAPPTTAPPTTAPPTTPTTVANQVNIVNLAFDPATIAVKAGDTVTWVNGDSTAHTVVADDGSFDSGEIAPGASFPFTFAAAGTVPYHCGIHPQMKGTVVVQ
jgi:plastocyanin